MQNLVLSSEPVEPNIQDNLTKTYQSLSLLEQFNSCVERFKDCLESPDSLESKVKELELVELELRALITALDDNNISIDIIKNETLRLRKSKVERLGIGPTIIRQRSVQGMTYAEIADFHSVSTSLISQFINKYDKCKPTEKQKIKSENSVFNTGQRLEELNLLIQRQLSNLESDPAVQVAYIREFRGLLDQASKIVSKQEGYIQYQRFVQGVAAVMEKVAPEQRQLINSEIRELVSSYQTTSQMINSQI